MPIHLRRAITRHEEWQLRVEHEVQVAHLIIVGCSSIDWAVDCARVKHACRFEGVAWTYEEVVLYGGKALG